MKKSLTIITLLFLTLSFAQNGINYKALIKDNSGNAIVNQAVTVQFQILEDGTTNVYQETHNPTTDANGIIITNIGEGTVVSGNFIAINWSDNNHFLNVQIDSGSGLVDLGTTQFKSVPYAMHAKTATSISSLPILDYKFPQGFIDKEIITTFASNSQPYVVPSGKTLYVTNIYSTSDLTVTSNGTTGIIASGGFNRNGPAARTLTNPLILGSGMEISGGAINGFLMESEASVQPVFKVIGLQFGGGYTVPSGKEFIILNLSSNGNVSDLIVGGRSIYGGPGNGPLNAAGVLGADFFQSFLHPIFAESGDVVNITGNGPTAILGYLIDN